MAPGVSILSTVPNGGYETFTGTSMASPHVAGVAGLLLAQRPLLTNGEVYSILRRPPWTCGTQVSTAKLALAAPAPIERSWRLRQRSHMCRCAASAIRAAQSPRWRESQTARACWASCAPCGTNSSPRSRAADGPTSTTPTKTKSRGRCWPTSNCARTLSAASMPWIRPCATLLTDAPSGAPALVTSDMVAAIRRPVMALAARTNPTLRAAILAEWARIAPERFVGQDVRLAWQQLRVENGPRHTCH